MNYIYSLTDPRNGQVRYVGKTTNPSLRLWTHQYNCQLSQRHSSCWVHGLRKAGLVPIMDILEIVSGEEWKVVEQRWIEMFKAAGHRLTNLMPGGEGGDTSKFRINRKWTPEQRAKYRATRKGMKIRTPSPELLKKRGLAIRQHWIDMAKLGIKKKGPVRTEAFKRHMSRVMKGRKPAPQTIEASLRARGLSRKEVLT